MDVFGVVYASCIAIGGVIGYMKAGSVPSLVAGLFFGLLAGYGSYETSTSGSVKIMLGASGILGVVMGVRFFRSFKLMPAGLIFLLSIIIFTRSVLRVWN